MIRYFPLNLLLPVLLISCAQPEPPPPTPAYRVMTYNIEDIRTDDLKNPNQPRLKAAARRIQELRPDILLINEITYDQPGTPRWEDGDQEGGNGQRFLDHFLAVPQAEGLQGLNYTVFMPPTNTGLASGFDFDRDGIAVTEVPVLPAPDSLGGPAPQTPEGRAYGVDSWGFGMFPGQYGMALYVRSDLVVMTDQVRSFQHFRWSDMPDHLMPVVPGTTEPWYADEAGQQFRLSSKNHVDVPVQLPGGAQLHLLISHPTPPAFDGDEERNKRRNHDEIRFWADYIAGRDYIEDDNGRQGGLAEEAYFVIMGDLNADPDEGSGMNNPAKTWLLGKPTDQ